MEETGNNHPATLPPAVPAAKSRAWRIVAIVLTLHAVLLGSFVLIQGCSKTESGPISETQPASEAKEPVVASDDPAKPALTPEGVALPGSDVLTPEEHLAEAASSTSVADAVKPQTSPTPVEESKIVETPTPVKPAVAAVKYKVKKGDTLIQVAKKNKISVQTLASANKLTVKSILKVGQVLNVPQAAKATVVAAVPAQAKPAGANTGSRTHLVRSGENPASIARKYGVTLQSLLTANHISDPRKIRINQKLVIPAAKVASGAVPVAEQPKGDLHRVATEEPVSAGLEVRKI